MNELNSAFAKTTKLLFGKELYPLQKYEDWLLKRIPKGENYKSSTSEKEIYLPNYSLFKKIPKDKISDLDSIELVSKRNIEVNENDGLKEISQKLKDISTYVVESINGKNIGVTESTMYANLCHAHKVIDCSNSRYSAYGFWNKDCEYAFGSYRSHSIKVGIHCYTSGNISMGFEVDSSKNCSNVMFCHNCDNVHDSLFCFDTKNKKYAIANVEVKPEIYNEVKKMLVGYVLENLEKRHYLNLDVYNVACKRIESKISKTIPLNEEKLL